jgi:alkylresorcinol/alkylpyrone synthase
VRRPHRNLGLVSLDDFLHDGQPEASADWWLTSFGAGFSAHACRVGVS